MNTLGSLGSRLLRRYSRSLCTPRLIAGQRVIGEPARLSDAQIIVQENPEVLPLENVSNHPSAKNVLHLNLPPERAARLGIYQVQDGNVEEVFRQTQVENRPLLPVLLLGPVITGEGGIGIFEGFLRSHRVDSGFGVRDVLKSKLGMDVVPISTTKGPAGVNER